MPRQKRQARFKRPCVFIVVEGKCSENNYFRHFSTRYVPVKIKVSDDKSAPGVVRTAETFTNGKWDYDYEGGDRVFCVFDRDGNTNEQLQEAFQEAGKNKFEIAYSNPCFELWILWHFQKISPYLKDCAAVEEKLAKPFEENGLGTYNKAKDYYYDIEPFQSNAVNWAKEKYNEFESNGRNMQKRDCNPSTGVYKLVEYLNKRKEFKGI